MCAACEFWVSGTWRLFVSLFVVRAVGSIEKGRSKTSLLLLLLLSLLLLLLSLELEKGKTSCCGVVLVQW